MCGEPFLRQPEIQSTMPSTWGTEVSDVGNSAFRLDLKFTSLRTCTLTLGHTNPRFNTPSSVHKGARVSLRDFRNRYRSRRNQPPSTPPNSPQSSRIPPHTLRRSDQSDKKQGRLVELPAEEIEENESPAPIELNPSRLSRSLEDATTKC
jgi:hypothetical protein